MSSTSYGRNTPRDRAYDTRNSWSGAGNFNNNNNNQNPFQQGNSNTSYGSNSQQFRGNTQYGTNPQQQYSNSSNKIGNYRIIKFQSERLPGPLNTLTQWKDITPLSQSLREETMHLSHIQLRVEDYFNIRTRNLETKHQRGLQNFIEKGAFNRQLLNSNITNNLKPQPSFFQTPVHVDDILRMANSSSMGGPSRYGNNTQNNMTNSYSYGGGNNNNNMGGGATNPFNRNSATGNSMNNSRVGNNPFVGNNNQGSSQNNNNPFNSNQNSSNPFQNNNSRMGGSTGGTGGNNPFNRNSTSGNTGGNPFNNQMSNTRNPFNNNNNNNNTPNNPFNNNNNNNNNGNNPFNNNNNNNSNPFNNSNNNNNLFNNGNRGNNNLFAGNNGNGNNGNNNGGGFNEYAMYQMMSMMQTMVSNMTNNNANQNTKNQQHQLEYTPTHMHNWFTDPFYDDIDTFKPKNRRKEDKQIIIIKETPVVSPSMSFPFSQRSRMSRPDEEHLFARTSSFSNDANHSRSYERIQNKYKYDLIVLWRQNMDEEEQISGVFRSQYECCQSQLAERIKATVLESESWIRRDAEFTLEGIQPIKSHQFYVKGAITHRKINLPRGYDYSPQQFEGFQVKGLIIRNQHARIQWPGIINIKNIDFSTALEMIPDAIETHDERLEQSPMIMTVFSLPQIVSKYLPDKKAAERALQKAARYGKLLNWDFQNKSFTFQVEPSTSNNSNQK